MSEPLPRWSASQLMPSLLSTAELYDLSYEQADVRIPVISVNPNQGCIGEVTAYAEKLALAVDASMKKAGITKPRTLGTPGKIWAITDRMDTWVCCCQFSSWVFACINHGFHERIITTRHGRPVLKLTQNRGGCHDLNHSDYSQICQIVAGWCLAKDVDEKRARWRKTEEIYLSPTLCHLVRPLHPKTGLATPAPDTHYRGNVRNVARPQGDCIKDVGRCQKPKKA